MVSVRKIGEKVDVISDIKNRSSVEEFLASEGHLYPTPDGLSVYDVPIRDVSGKMDCLAPRKGNVTMIVNVTGECGNSMQYPMLQVLQYDYADRGFEVVCVPTNDYCEFGYGDFKDSRSTAEECHKFAYQHYRIRLPFTELVASRHNREDEPEQHPHLLFERLGVDIGEIRGNFEKFVVSRDGRRISRFTNGSLLPSNLESGWSTFDPQDALRRIRASIELFLDEPYDA